jgi:membrane protease YdiL (CAAX protease family)
LSAEDLTILVVTIGTIGIGYGLAYWAHRAANDRSAYVGLFLLFGIPGVLLIVLGAAFAFNGRDGGWVALATGLGLCLPLMSPVRRTLATYAPFDPDSPVDMAGLCVVLAVIGLLSTTYAISPEPTDTGGNVSSVALFVQFVAEISFAYILVGFTITRNFRQATARLGLNRPTATMIGLAVGLVVLAFIVVLLGGVATSLFQPDVSKEIDKITKEITSDVQNPIGAMLFGLGSGAGEELLLRGAIQPRFGLLTTTVLFGLLHSQYGISFVLLSIFVVGAILGLERKYLGTTASVITHAIFNALAVLI